MVVGGLVEAVSNQNFSERDEEPKGEKTEEESKKTVKEDELET